MFYPNVVRHSGRLSFSVVLVFLKGTSTTRKKMAIVINALTSHPSHPPSLFPSSRITGEKKLEDMREALKTIFLLVFYLKICETWIVVSGIEKCIVRSFNHCLI